ncbi:hypothetical protein K3495_g13241 [Podosphaera aphanis]|nr:hypothetical protein K3495_g13241 [Podosphaera aphanis]
MGSMTRRFGYADDIAILETQKSLHDNCSSLTRALKEALDWGLDEGITFDPAKAELLHFLSKRTDKNPVNTTSVSHDVFSVSENTNRPYTRWLEVYFDRIFSFKWPVRFLAKKSLVVANSLRSLGNTLWGAPPKLLRQAVTACILPIAYYGVETWRPGLTRAISPTRTIPNLVKGHLSLQKFVRTSARAILPVYWTTSAGALYTEAGLSPPEIALDIKLRQASLRIHRLDPRHSLRRRNIWILSQQRHVSRLSRWALDIPPTEYLDPLFNSPLLVKESWCSRIRRVTMASCRLPDGIPSQDMVIYLDGGRLESDLGPRVGGGVAILQAGRVICQKRKPLSPSFETFDVESAAILTDLETAIDLPSA